MLLIDYDDEKDGQTKAQAMIDPNASGDNPILGVITVRSDEMIFKSNGTTPKYNSGIIKLLHELGHIVANTFGMPAAAKQAEEMANPMVRAVAIITGKNTSAVIPAEEEAWDLAQAMFDDMKTHGIDSYKATGVLPEFPEKPKDGGLKETVNEIISTIKSDKKGKNE